MNANFGCRRVLRFGGVDIPEWTCSRSIVICQRFLCRHPVSINMPPIRQFSARGRATLTFTVLPENMYASYKREANTPAKVEVSTTYRFGLMDPNRIDRQTDEQTGGTTELYVGTGRSHAHSGLTPTHRHLACVLLLYCQCPAPVLLWQLWSGSATYQICFRLTIPNPNHNPIP